MGRLVNLSVRLLLDDDRAQQLVHLSLHGRAVIVAIVNRVSLLHEFRTRIRLAETGPEDRPTELLMVSSEPGTSWSNMDRPGCLVLGFRLDRDGTTELVAPVPDDSQVAQSALSGSRLSR